jgi:hypothetical protein
MPMRVLPGGRGDGPKRPTTTIEVPNDFLAMLAKIPAWVWFVMAWLVVCVLARDDNGR